MFWASVPCITLVQNWELSEVLLETMKLAALERAVQVETIRSHVHHFPVADFGTIKILSMMRSPCFFFSVSCSDVFSALVSPR